MKGSAISVLATLAMVVAQSAVWAVSTLLKKVFKLN
jgi:hypothetical protein